MIQSVSFVLRAFRPSDIPELADLWVQSWQVTMPEIDFGARRPWICDQLARQAETGTLTLCAEDANGVLHGFAMFEPERHYLEQLAVSRAAFGTGLARALLDAVKNFAPGGLTLRVNQDNRRAVRFYLREGFQITAAGTNPGGVLKTWDMTWRPDGCTQEIREN